jgi:hypothetical protein
MSEAHIITNIEVLSTVYINVLQIQYSVTRVPSYECEILARMHLRHY